MYGLVFLQLLCHPRSEYLGNQVDLGSELMSCASMMMPELSSESSTSMQRPSDELRRDVYARSGGNDAWNAGT